VKTLGLNAKGAKCESLGHRPRETVERVFSAEGAKCDCPRIITAIFERHVPISRVQRFQEFMNLYLGRCPRLLHFTPLALRPGLQNVIRLTLASGATALVSVMAFDLPFI
jgi:hypothetical protein